jgi:hypothetical protein
MEVHKKKIHQFECNAEVEIEAYEDHVNEFLCGMLYHFNWDADSMRVFFEQNQSDKTVFDFDLSNPEDPMYYKNLLLAALCKIHPDEILVNTGICYMNPKIKKLFSSQENKRFLRELMKKLLGVNLDFFFSLVRIDMTVDEPCQSIFRFLPPKAVGLKTELMSPFFAISDPYKVLLKHNCMPAVILEEVGGKVIWVVIRKIPAHTPILKSYVDFTDSKLERQFMLKLKGMICNCLTCTQNWPSWQEYRRGSSKEVCHKLEVHELSYAGAYKASCSLLDKYSESLPNAEFMNVLGEFIILLNILKQPRLLTQK